MSNFIHFETITEMFRLIPKARVKHPLVAVIDFSKYPGEINAEIKMTSGCYSILFKNHCLNKLKYGQKSIDFQDGSLLCIGPRQVIAFDETSEDKSEINGWGIFFHPDLVRGTSLGRTIKDYTFFAYETSEALHLSDKEKETLNEIAQKIDTELSENIDRHSQTLIVSNIELLLNYCRRYYDRQFITRKTANSDLLTKIENVLTRYFQSNNLREEGLPSVKYLADQVNLSSNYLSDLLKRETGMNAQDRIHYYLIEEAKNLLLGSDKTVSELAYTLGFEYPQYFSRLFKTKTGMTPLEYRKLN
jgi:AraC-like DNA-binding protein